MYSLRGWLCRWLYHEESPNEMTATSPQVPIIDADGTEWTLTHSTFSGLKIVRNGITDHKTGSVVLLVYWNHTIYQQTNCGWWLWDGSHWLIADYPLLYV